MNSTTAILLSGVAVESSRRTIFMERSKRAMTNQNTLLNAARFNVFIVCIRRCRFRYTSEILVSKVGHGVSEARRFDIMVI